MQTYHVTFKWDGASQMLKDVEAESFADAAAKAKEQPFMDPLELGAPKEIMVARLDVEDISELLSWLAIFDYETLKDLDRPF